MHEGVCHTMPAQRKCEDSTVGLTSLRVKLASFPDLDQLSLVCFMRRESLGMR